ncbi:hypothetical protein PQQ99_22680 [Paraburkholderia sediminicola]|uniref:hypothetical protein n=1 Tax=Paraburkholderia sediminicola TaxID=458836 RepID=UPI0038B6CA0B
MNLFARAARPTIIAALCCALNAHADQLPASLQKSLKPYSISDASIEGGALKVTMKRPTVTHTMFYNIVSRGACSPLWDNGKAWGAASITRVEVRNATGAQGFAFRGGRKECAELGNVSGGDAEAHKYVDARTWVCVAGMECRPRRPGEVIAGDE